MAIQIQGNGGTIAEVDGSNFRAQRMTLRPSDHGSNGHFSYGGLSGIVPAALGANSEIFQFRWVDATRLCGIQNVRISACVTTTFFAAGVPVQIDLAKATGWSVQGTGGTGVTPAALLKKRTAMASTLVATGDIRIATTAALGAGTKTLEGVSMATIVAPGPITASLNGTIIPAGTVMLQSDPGGAGMYPLVLAANEGFIIRSIAVPATGTWMFAVSVDWVELDAY